MSSNYSQRFKIMFNTICSDEIKEFTHVNNKNSFTRKRKMPLNDIILSTLVDDLIDAIVELSNSIDKYNF